MRTLPLVLLLACGAPGSEDTQQPDPPLCLDEPVPEAPLRMLTRTQIDESVDLVLGVEGTARSRLPADPKTHGFEGFAEHVSVSRLAADGYLRSSEDVTSQIDWASALPCSTTTRDAECGQRLIDDLGPRLFRRPLTPEERGIFVSLFEDLTASQDFDSAAAAVVQAMLQSPQFLYRVEIGGSELVNETVRLTDYELATRLSLLLWGTTPDDALLAAAAAGTLSDPSELSAEVNRLLADPRAAGVVGRFAEQWMGIDTLQAEVKDGAAYPEWSGELALDLREETRRFVTEVVLTQEAGLDELFTAPYTVANASVAAHYGLAGASSVDEWLRLDLPADQRAGLLTQPSFLAAAAHSNQTSPVHRGLFVFEQLFCGIQPQPPDDLDITLPPLDDTLSTRERFARHTQDPLCADCHSFMDPIGFGFEHYDAVGVWRDVEGADLPVDGSGILTYSSQQGPFDGAVELAARVAAAPEVETCFATQWFRTTWGREPLAADACTVEQLADALRQGAILDMIRAIPHTETFQTRPVVVP